MLKAECLLNKIGLFWFRLCQMTAKTLAEQQEQLKRLEMISSLQETNKMLKADRDKLEQELQQAQAKVKSRHRLITCHHSSNFTHTPTFISSS